MAFPGAIIKPHARQQMVRRGISESDVLQVLSDPEAVVEVRLGRVVAQYVIDDRMLRVFLDVDREPPEVVTAYRTSKIEKYRSQP